MFYQVRDKSRKNKNKPEQQIQILGWEYQPEQPLEERNIYEVINKKSHLVSNQKTNQKNQHKTRNKTVINFPFIKQQHVKTNSNKLLTQNSQRKQIVENSKEIIYSELKEENSPKRLINSYKFPSKTIEPKQICIGTINFEKIRGKNTLKIIHEEQKIMDKFIPSKKSNSLKSCTNSKNNIFNYLKPTQKNKLVSFKEDSKKCFKQLKDLYPPNFYINKLFNSKHQLKRKQKDQSNPMRNFEEKLILQEFNDEVIFNENERKPHMLKNAQNYILNIKDYTKFK